MFVAKNGFVRFFVLIIVSFQMVFPCILSAGEIQAIPLIPGGQPDAFAQPPMNLMQRQQSDRSPMQSPPQSISRRQPKQEFIQEGRSEFEQYVSDQRVDITDTQFEILKKYEGVSFVNQVKASTVGMAVIPVRIIKQVVTGSATSSKVVDAGFLIGASDPMSAAFKAIGIKSSIAVSTDLKQFGYSLFDEPSSFVASETVPVGPDYVVGPGDEIRVTIWGKIDGQWTAAVDRDGSVNLPKIGSLGVTGLTFRELKETLHKELSKYYTGFEMNVSMGALRTMRVYLVGNAARPGAYTISSLSTLVNAMFEAGGPGKAGSMRDVQVKRRGKTVVHFDMYDFLLKGDKSNDIRLMPEDVIFIPPVGPLAAIAGSVNSPAIYELKGEKKISELIEMAGGMSTVAFKGRVQIERIVDSRKQVVFESDIDSLQGKDLAVQSGDVVRIFQVIQDRKTVLLSGAVQREGEYGFSSDMTIKSLISAAGGLKYYAYTSEAELTRVSVTEKGPKTEKIFVNLETALKGDANSNIKLKEDDYLMVRAVPEWQLYRKVTIKGEVKFPGFYTIKKGEKLSSLIERAGGYGDRAYLRGAIFTRESVREMQQKSLEEMVVRLEKELVGAGAQSIAVASPEELQAKKALMESKKAFVETLKQLKSTGRLTVRIAHLRLLKGSEYDIELQEGDTLTIPEKNDVVGVTGSVMSSGTHVYSDKLDYKDYIEMAGGYSENADAGNAYVLKVDGSARKLSKSVVGWNPLKSRWEMSAFGEEPRTIDPGDTIVVPEKLERIAWLKEIKDFTQILMQIAVSAGVVLKL